MGWISPPLLDDMMHAEAATMIGPEWGQRMRINTQFDPIERGMHIMLSVEIEPDWPVMVGFFYDGLVLPVEDREAAILALGKAIDDRLSGKVTWGWDQLQSAKQQAAVRWGPMKVAPFARCFSKMVRRSRRAAA